MECVAAFFLQSEPGPRSLSRRAEAAARAEATAADVAAAVAARSPERKASASSRGTAGSDPIHDPTDNTAASASRKGAASRDANSRNRGGEGESAPSIFPIADTHEDSNSSMGQGESIEQPKKSSTGRRRSSEQEVSEGNVADEGRDADGTMATGEEVLGAQVEAAARTRGRRSIKRPARYEEWLAETSQEADDHHAAAPPAAPMRHSHPKRGRGASGGPVFAIPRGIKRKDELTMEPAPPSAELLLPRNAAKAGAITTRKRRLMPWIDLAAIEASVASSAAQPTHDADRAIATGVTAAAAAVSAVAVTAAGLPGGSTDGNPPEGGSFYDDLQTVLQRAREAFKSELGMGMGDRNRNTIPATASARATEKGHSPSEEVATSRIPRHDEVMRVSASPENNQGLSSPCRRSSDPQKQRQQQRVLPASATQWPSLTRAFEEVAERAAREAAAFGLSAGHGGTLSPNVVHIGPESVRRFLLKHGRKPPVPAMRAPPQRAHQQLQMIQEQLMEQHRQHRMREEQRIQQHNRSRVHHQQRHMESLGQGRRNDQIHLHLQFAQEQQRTHKLQRRQEIELNDLKEDLERKLIRSMTKEEKAKQPVTCGVSDTEVRHEQPPSSASEEPQCVERQEDRVLEQLQRLALLGSIDTLFSQEESPLPAERQGTVENQEIAEDQGAAEDQRTPEEGQDLPKESASSTGQGRGGEGAEGGTGPAARTGKPQRWRAGHRESL